MRSMVSVVTGHIEEQAKSTSYLEVLPRQDLDTLTILDPGSVDSFLQHPDNQRLSILFTMEAKSGNKLAFLLDLDKYFQVMIPYIAFI